MSKEYTNDPKLIALKKEADSLGVKYHPMVGYAKLSARIAEHLAHTTPPPPITPTQEPPVETAVTTAPAPKFVPETENQKLMRLRREQTRLIRVMVHCNNDEKKDWEGEFIKVGNDVVGSITKFIPFDNEAGYHVPVILLDSMRERVCQKWKTVRGSSGAQEKVSFTVPEFTITELPDLSSDELAELADDQRARGAID